MKKQNVTFLTQAAMIAAIYVVLTYVFAPFSFGEVQVRIAEALDLAQQNGFPAWVTVDPKKFEGTFKNAPARDEVAPEINEALIIERYSR